MRYVVVLASLALIFSVVTLVYRTSKPESEEVAISHMNEASLWFRTFDSGETTLQLTPPGRSLDGSACFRTTDSSVVVALIESRMEIRITANYSFQDPACLLMEVGSYVVTRASLGNVQPGSYQVYLGEVFMGELDLPVRETSKFSTVSPNGLLMALMEMPGLP